MIKIISFVICVSLVTVKVLLPALEALRFSVCSWFVYFLGCDGHCFFCWVTSLQQDIFFYTSQNVTVLIHGMLVSFSFSFSFSSSSSSGVVRVFTKVFRSLG